MMAVRVAVIFVLLQGATSAIELLVGTGDRGREDGTSNAFRSTEVRTMTVEAERGSGQGKIMWRSKASGKKTVLLNASEVRTMSFTLSSSGGFLFSIRYSNDNDNSAPCETVSIRVDGSPLGSFVAADTGDGGVGWNTFRTAGNIGSRSLAAGKHRIRISTSGGDLYGIEIDCARLKMM
ncbi:MAG: hypothetical protein HYX75_03080 [Acidobacteria bacterium]|nr:hypothetical protein [Acidobacteriota bacterium]